MAIKVVQSVDMNDFQIMNFVVHSASSSPTNSGNLGGMMWWDDSNDILKVYNDGTTSWESIVHGYDIVTTLGNPGTDTNLVTEQGIKTAIDSIISTTPTTELLIAVRNETGLPLTKGQVVQITGYSSLPLVEAASNTSSTGYFGLGVLIEDIADSSDGQLAILGQVETNTIAYSLGDKLYLSTGGALVNTPPTSGAIIFIGQVTKVSTSGEIILYNDRTQYQLSAAQSQDLVLRMGSDLEAQKLSFRNYSNAELAYINALGILHIDSITEFSALNGVNVESVNFKSGDITLLATGDILWGDGDTGIYESADDILKIKTLAIDRVTIDSSGLAIGVNNTRPILRDVGATATVPNIVPQWVDTDTGIGSNALDELSLIAGGVEALRLTTTNALFAGDVHLIDDKKIYFGTGDDGYIYHDGLNLYMDNTFGDIFIRYTATQKAIQIAGTGGQVTLFNGDFEKLRTTTSGIYVTGEVKLSEDIHLLDNKKLYLGTSDDSAIFFNAANTVISYDAINPAILITTATGATGLYFGGFEKFTTSTTGATLAGKLDIDTSATQIWEDGAGNMTFKDTITGEKTLAQLAYVSPGNVVNQYQQTGNIAIWHSTINYLTSDDDFTFVSDRLYVGTDGVTATEIGFTDIQIFDTSAEIMHLDPSVATGTAVAYKLATKNVLYSGDILFELYNTSFPKFTVDFDGNVNIPSGSVYKINGVALDYVSAATHAVGQVAYFTTNADEIQSDGNLAYNGSTLDLIGTFKTDTINEHTLDAGVIINGFTTINNNGVIESSKYEAGNQFSYLANGVLRVNKIVLSGSLSDPIFSISDNLSMRTDGWFEFASYDGATPKLTIEAAGDIVVHNALEVDTVREYNTGVGVTVASSVKLTGILADETEIHLVSVDDTTGLLSKRTLSGLPFEGTDATIVRTGQANTYDTFAQAFPSTALQIRNLAGTFNYSFVSSAIAAARNITLPLLTGNDTMVTEAMSQTLTNKSISLGTNTVSGGKVDFNAALSDGTFMYVGDAPTSHTLLSHTISGETIGHVLAADSATTYSIRQLLGSEINNDLGWGTGTVTAATHALGQVAYFTSTANQIQSDANLTYNGSLLDLNGTLYARGVGTGDLDEIDAYFGDAVTTPTYGMIAIGSAVLGRTSHTATDGAPAYNLNGAFVFQNSAGPITGDIEFGFLDSSGLLRFGLPKSAVGNATYNPRSMIIAGPAVADSDVVTLAYWQTQGIFGNLTMDTSLNGADLGVQNDLEVEGDIFTDSIKESTVAAGITLGSNVNLTSISADETETYVVAIDNTTGLLSKRLVSGISSDAQDLGFTVATGEITISGGSNVTVGSFGTTNTNYGFVVGSDSVGATHYLDGSGNWSVPAGTGDVTKLGSTTAGMVATWDGTGTDIEGSANLIFDGSLLTLSTTGSEQFRMVDSNGTTATDSTTWISFNYGAIPTRIGYVGFGIDTDDDLRLHNDIGGVLIRAANTTIVDVQSTGVDITGNLDVQQIYALGLNMHKTGGEYIRLSDTDGTSATDSVVYMSFNYGTLGAETPIGHIGFTQSGDDDLYIENSSSGGVLLQANNTTIVDVQSTGVDITGTLSVSSLAAASTVNVVNYNTGTGDISYNASGGGTTNYLRADGSWAAPSGLGDVTEGTGAVDNAIAFWGATPPSLDGDADLTWNGAVLSIGNSDNSYISISGTGGVHTLLGDTGADSDGQLILYQSAGGAQGVALHGDKTSLFYKGVDITGDLGLDSGLITVTKDASDSQWNILDNPNASVSARIGWQFKNNLDDAGYISVTSSTYTGVSGWQDAFVIQADGDLAGGIQYHTTQGHHFSVTTAGTSVMDVVSTGVDITGTLKVSDFAGPTTTANMLYYNITTGVITHGAAPTGSGDVTQGTGAADNRIAFWGTPPALDGDTNLTWDGTDLGITGDIEFGTGANRRIGVGDGATGDLTIQAGQYSGNTGHDLYLAGGIGVGIGDVHLGNDKTYSSTYIYTYGDILFPSSRTIRPSDRSGVAGYSLTIKGGKNTSGNFDGGDLNLYGGDGFGTSAGGDILLQGGASLGGGDISLYPGEGTSSDGDLYLNSNKGTSTGTGDVFVKSLAATSADEIVTIDSNGVLKTRADVDITGGYAVHFASVTPTLKIVNSGAEGTIYSYTITNSDYEDTVGSVFRIRIEGFRKLTGATGHGSVDINVYLGTQALCYTTMTTNWQNTEFWVEVLVGCVDTTYSYASIRCQSGEATGSFDTVGGEIGLTFSTNNNTATHGTGDNIYVKFDDTETDNSIYTNLILCERLTS